MTSVPIFKPHFRGNPHNGLGHKPALVNTPGIHRSIQIDNAPEIGFDFDTHEEDVTRYVTAILHGDPIC